MRVLGGFAVILLAACTSTGVVPADGDTYLIGKKSAEIGLGPPVKTEAAVFAEASEFCDAQGKEVETADLIIRDTIAGRRGAVNLKFRCVDPVTSTAAATPAGEPAIEEPEALEVCRDLSLVAREVMQYRQQDRPMSEALTKAIEWIRKWVEPIAGDEAPQELDEKVEELAAIMVMEAYDVMISTPPFQPQAITEFENEAFRECYEEWASDSEEWVEIEP